MTGATGFVGWHVAEAFRDDGWHVRAIVRPDSRKPLPAGVEAIRAPLLSAWLGPAVDGTDVVVHCAGAIRAASEAAFSAVNVEGTRAIVDAANAAGVRMVLVSSQAAAGAGTAARPRREDDPPQPVNAYGRSKLAAEEVVRSRARVPWAIVRPCAAYGPRDRGFLPLFRFARRGFFLLPTAPSMAFSLIAVADLARAIVLAVKSERAAGETVFLGHAEPQTTENILQTLAQVFSRTYRPRRVPRPLFRVAAFVGDTAWKWGGQFPVDSSRLAEFSAEGFVCSVERARDVIGFDASTGFAEGIRETAWWYQKEGWI